MSAVGGSSSFFRTRIYLWLKQTKQETFDINFPWRLESRSRRVRLAIRTEGGSIDSLENATSRKRVLLAILFSIQRVPFQKDAIPSISVLWNSQTKGFIDHSAKQQKMKIDSIDSFYWGQIQTIPPASDNMSNWHNCRLHRGILHTGAG